RVLDPGGIVHGQGAQLCGGTRAHPGEFADPHRRGIGLGEQLGQGSLDVVTHQARPVGTPPSTWSRYSLIPKPSWPSQLNRVNASVIRVVVEPRRLRSGSREIASPSTS